MECPAMATNVPPSDVEPPYRTDTERRPFDDPPYSAPAYGRRSGSGLWIPIILGALVVLGLLYWLSTAHRGVETASNNTATTTVQPAQPPVQPAPPVTQPPAAQPSGTNP